MFMCVWRICSVMWSWKYIHDREYNIPCTFSQAWLHYNSDCNWMSIFSKIHTTEPHRLPSQAIYGMSIVSSKSVSSTLVSAIFFFFYVMLCALSCYTSQHVITWPNSISVCKLYPIKLVKQMKRILCLISRENLLHNVCKTRQIGRIW